MSNHETMDRAKSTQMAKKRKMADSDTDYDVSCSRDLLHTDEEDDASECFEEFPNIAIHQPPTNAPRVFPFNEVPDDPRLCSTIINEMCSNLIANERFDIYHQPMFETLCRKSHYERDRYYLIDQIVNASLSSHISSSTLWLAMSILDRYLFPDYKHISKVKLMRLSAAAMSIARKYTEGLVLKMSLRPTNGVYIESRIMTKLAFDIDIPTTYHFVHYLLELVHASSFLRSVACYYAESTLYAVDMLKLRPSLIAASAVYAALYLCNEYPHGEFPQVHPTICDLSAITNHSKGGGMDNNYHTPKIQDSRQDIISNVVLGNESIEWMCGPEEVYYINDKAYYVDDNDITSYIDSNCSNSNMSNDTSSSEPSQSYKDDTPTPAIHVCQRLISCQLWGLHLMMDEDNNNIEPALSIEKIAQKISKSSFVARLNIDDVIATAKAIIKNIKGFISTTSTSSMSSSSRAQVRATDFSALKSKFSSDKYHQVSQIALPKLCP